MLSKEQADTIKQQLLQQLDKFPKEQQGFIKDKVMSMNEKEFEQFLIQNKLIQPQGQTENQPTPNNQQNPNQTPQNTQSSQQEQQCIFCSIIQGKIPTYKLDENKKNIAILEINPASKAHSLVVPKEHIEETTKLPSSSFTLAKKLAKKIKRKYKPEEIKISSTKMFNHSLVEILPIYKDTDPSKRQKASEKELLKLQLELEHKKRKSTKKSTTKTTKNQSKKSNLPQLSKRIP